MVTSAFVGFGFGVDWRSRDIVFYLMLATMTIPTWSTIVPLYILFTKIGWGQLVQAARRPRFLL